MAESNFSNIRRAMTSSIPPNLDNSKDEKEHYCRIIAAFKLYKHFSLARVDRNEEFLNSLEKKYQDLLEKHRGHLAEFKKCVAVNQLLLNLIVQNVSSMFENVQPVPKEMINEILSTPNIADIEKVQTTLKQFVRDWSEEGADERKACYDRIINEIVENFPPDKFNLVGVKVLVPGAGLGRLAFEIVKRGYSCEGNEFSLFMLFASNFVLNKCPGTRLHVIHPWIHQFDNNWNASSQMESVSIPDVNPLDLGQTSARFTMTAGDFLEIYKGPCQWDCVATCFFIDCAKNIVEFVESIYRILKPGGLWVNFGPLLYHFTNSIRAESLEISYEDLRRCIVDLGFEFEKEELGLKTRYAQNKNSMLQYEYECAFFVCRKPSASSLTSISDLSSATTDDEVSSEVESVKENDKDMDNEKDTCPCPSNEN